MPHSSSKPDKYEYHPLPAGPQSHSMINMSLSSYDRFKLVQLDPRYPDLRLFSDGRFGMRLYLNGVRRIIGSIDAWELGRWNKGDLIHRVNLTGNFTQLGPHGELCNHIIFNTEPIPPGRRSYDGSNNAILSVIDKLSDKFGTAIAMGKLTRDSVLVLECATHDDGDGPFIETYSTVSADRNSIWFCTCSASEMHDGTGDWEFRLFVFQIQMEPSYA